MEQKRIEIMARKREREEKEEPGKLPPGDGKLGDLLVDKVLEKLDTKELAGNMAQGLAGRLLWSLNMDVLSDRVLDKLAVNLASDKALMEEVSAQVLKRLKTAPEITVEQT